MPFTPSHAVVALPFLRTPLVPAAIAVGAMTPDLPLFVRVLPLDYETTHAFAWLPLTIAIALALLLVWRCVLRPATRELSPRWLARRLPADWDAGAGGALRETFGGAPGRRPSWGAAALLVVSLAIGIASHIVWDLFTHEARWGSKVIPALGEEWGPLPGYRWLQYGSSVIGLTIIGVWMLVWIVRRQPGPEATRLMPSWLRWAWWISLPVSLLAAWAWGLAAFGPLGDEFTIPHLAYRVLPPTCAIWGVATVALCLVVQVRRDRSARRRLLASSAP